MPLTRERWAWNPDAARHPNELDVRRIQKSLEKRRRYRYVSPNVRQTPRGYLIESPCCSRSVDPEGGVIDVALIQYGGGRRPWRLLEKDHARGEWRLHSQHASLTAALECLNEDARREFWK